MSRLFRDSAFTSLAEVAGAVSTLLTAVIVARSLGAEGKGAFTLAVGVGAISGQLLGLRWERAVGHFLARDAAQLPSILTSVALVPCLACGMGVLAYRAWPALLEQTLLPGLDPAVIPPCLALIASTYLWRLLPSVLGGLRHFAARSLFMLSSSVVQVVAVGALGAARAEHVASYLWLVFGAGAVLYLGWLVGLAIYFRARPTLNIPLLWRMAWYGAKSHSALMLELLIMQSGLFMLNYFRSPAEAGVYSIALGLANQMGRLPTIFATVVFHRVSAGELGRGEQTARVLRLTGIAMTGIAALTILAGWFLIVPVFGREFAPAAGLLAVQAPAMVFLGLFRIAAADIEGRSRPIRIVAGTAVAAVVLVLLNLWWIPALGSMGAVLASLVSCAILYGLTLISYCRLSGIAWSETWWPQRKDAGRLMTYMNRAR